MEIIYENPDEGNFAPSELAVKLLPVNDFIGPSAIAVTVAGILLADATDVSRSLHGPLTIQNLGPNPIYIAMGPSATVIPTGLTTLTGIEIAAGLSYTIDLWGGMAVWARAAVLQVAPADTRVSGAKRT